MCDHAHSDCLTILQEIRDELRQIRAAIRPKRCTARDIEILERLLPAITGLLGSQTFRTRDILADPAIAAIAGSSGPTGALLARAVADNAIIEGLQVHRCKKDHNAIQWWIDQCLPPPIDTHHSQCSNGDNKEI